MMTDLLSNFGMENLVPQECKIFTNDGNAKIEGEEFKV